jgi:regulator of replication initiation timing
MWIRKKTLLKQLAESRSTIEQCNADCSRLSDQLDVLNKENQRLKAEILEKQKDHVRKMGQIKKTHDKERLARINRSAKIVDYYQPILSEAASLLGTHQKFKEQIPDRIRTILSKISELENKTGPMLTRAGNLELENATLKCERNSLAHERDRLVEIVNRNTPELVFQHGIPTVRK